MSESLKTILFSLVAAMAIGVAYLVRPEPIRVADDSGQRFFDAFDPLAAKSLTIVRFPEDAAAPIEFKVQQVNGLWTLPSEEGYPADAEKQLAAAAAAIADVVKGPLVTSKPSDHETFGVLDPGQATGGGTAVGVHVTLADDAGRTLVDYIIGLPVKDQPDHRYLRQAGKDAVYSARISTDKLTTDFSEWIEKDLLKINTPDIASIRIDAYSVDIDKGVVNKGDEITLGYDGTTRQWSIDNLPEGMELNTARVEDLKAALSDLRIVDVRRKPSGLSADLKLAAGIHLDNEAVVSLHSKGYYLTADGGLASNEGEMSVNLRTGVRYALRFGEVVSAPEGASDSGGTSLHRYLFIMAEFDQSLVPAPQPTPLPDFPAAPSDGASSQPEMTDEMKSVMEEARKKVEEANARKQAEYEKALADGQAKVNELNRRFADWYYVISDEVYKRLKATRNDLVIPATAAPPNTTESAEPPGMLVNPPMPEAED